MSHATRSRSQFLAVLLTIAAPAAGCITDDPAADEVAPVAMLAGSTQAAELGVVTWEVRGKGDEVRVIGLDELGARRTEMIVRQLSADRVEVEALFPEPGVFELARGGIVDGAASDQLRKLGAAANADMGERSVPARDHGPLVPAVFLQGEGHLDMGWSFFGYSGNIDVNNWCQQGTRDHFDAYSSNGASCWVNRWTSESQYDCRINLHYGISGFRTDTCNWFVYSNP